ncbi:MULTISPECIES: formyltransferase family protein [unclassified Pseudovibrio]|uniref:formyltransferase family protein n=1 Tax=unclassified Pseudovibrio TaxID=2627060 RepID=UPI0007AE6EDF|nr:MULTISPECIES: formyltransferase family protein [unclassified Pseudovibrio]KZL01349.1 Phosphoribosylglycinamide formyltransferase [Pseudovibrio sp. W74]KZL08951.1 Phosphoribosylglycinamide formyltransferase [Pseudovibrio sp. Ad14]
MKVVIIGQKWLGERALEMVLNSGHDVVKVIAPESDRLNTNATSKGLAVSIPPSRQASVTALDVPDCDIIICAHAHVKLAPCALLKPRHGAIGYHPSLLPLYRGKNAIADTLKEHQKIIGGSVYLLDDGWDTGPVLFQDWSFVQDGDDAASIWRRVLAPMGLELLERAVSHLEAFGHWPEAQMQKT